MSGTALEYLQYLIPLRNILPHTGNEPVQQVLNGDAFLFHGVAVADGHRVFEGRIVFSEGFEVHRDAEGGAHFILAAVAAARKILSTCSCV